MKQSLVLALALLLLVAAWASGCAEEPTPNVLRDTPGASAQTVASGEMRETTPAATAVPTMTSQAEEQWTAPAPTPAALEEQPPTEADPVVGSPTVTPVTGPSLPTPARREIVNAPLSENLIRLIDLAKQDLARRLEITPDDIEVVHIERAEWLDTSLGCAKPGLSRLPVAIPGYRVILSARGWQFVYHTGRESGVVYCPKG